ncbi:unnamed protein product [Rotaria sp. Silwood2]|nr:unnamed protein product [Rotaria sp. Silwood2]CAF2929014.1 unnamed protein product [Rotaria sp. Silwood2]CAF3321327.1 unnamed protein product [Rotaria sp. Silwood2]CAF4121796.1 unnamed protein product [Rotaria sp. Silwood2]CAF4235350.1 unnamed protein product [Rotaria sp. Silwood2]
MSCAGLGAGLIMPVIDLHSWNDGAAQSMFGTTCRSSLKATRQGKSSAIEAAFVDWMNQANNAGLFSSSAEIGKK